jgi:hypothetical protein
MGAVVLDMSMSLDGFVTGPNPTCGDAAWGWWPDSGREVAEAPRQSTGKRAGGRAVP